MKSGAPRPVIFAAIPVLAVDQGRRVRAIVEETGADCVFCASNHNGELLTSCFTALKKTSVDVRSIPDCSFFLAFPMNFGVSTLRLPIISLREGPFGGLASGVKRAFDVAGALFGLLLFWGGRMPGSSDWGSKYRIADNGFLHTAADDYGRPGVFPLLNSVRWRGCEASGRLCEQAGSPLPRLAVARSRS